MSAGICVVSSIISIYRMRMAVSRILVKNMETKKQIRRAVLEKRNQMTESERAQKSRIICGRLFAMEEFTAAQDILLYASYGSEVETDSVFVHAVSLGKHVYYPRVEGENMRFLRIHALSELAEGYKGIREPDLQNEDMFCGDGTDALLIMPGVAFDEERNRIGYGKGFYDRFLQGGFAGYKIALCFSLQILSQGRIPAEKTDIRPDRVLSENICLEENL